MSYIQKMEKERLARQHGAQQDNRSFLQKYVGLTVTLKLVSALAAFQIFFFSCL